MGYKHSQLHAMDIRTFELEQDSISKQDQKTSHEKQQHIKKKKTSKTKYQHKKQNVAIDIPHSPENAWKSVREKNTQHRRKTSLGQKNEEIR